MYYPKVLNVPEAGHI